MTGEDKEMRSLRFWRNCVLVCLCLWAILLVIKMVRPPRGGFTVVIERKE